MAPEPDGAAPAQRAALAAQGRMHTLVVDDPTAGGTLVGERGARPAELCDLHDFIRLTLSSAAGLKPIITANE